MPVFDPEIDRLLYDDEDGMEVGLDEVQLLDDPAPKRVARLIALLEADDPYLVAQVTEVLAAWAVPEGLDSVEEAAKAGGPPGEPLTPHRLYGYDETLDRYAEAVKVALLNGASPTRVRRIYQQLLSVYGPVQFESRLKRALLKWKGEPLVAEVEQAIDRALGEGHPYMASQLLPVLARWDEGAFWAQLEHFEDLKPRTPDFRANIAEALGHIGGARARAQLEVLSGCDSAAVRDEARKALGAGRTGRR